MMRVNNMVKKYYGVNNMVKKYYDDNYMVRVYACVWLETWSEMTGVGRRYPIG